MNNLFSHIKAIQIICANVDKERYIHTEWTFDLACLDTDVAIPHQISFLIKINSS